MMQLKFRAWNRVDKIMGGSFTIGDWTGSYSMSDMIDCTDISYMQFTGLNDKNGNEIYFHDFIKINEDIMLVVWRDDLASFALRKNGWAFDHFFKEAVNAKDTEVVGNLHENPELLKT